MKAAPVDSPGLLSSLHELGDQLLGGAQERLELFTIELQEEKFRLVQTFIWISVALFIGMMTLIFASLTVVYCFWATARLPVLVGLTGFYAVALVWVIFTVRRLIAKYPAPFISTRQELLADRACIQPEN